MGEEHTTAVTRADSPYALPSLAPRPARSETLRLAGGATPKTESGVSTPAEAIELDEVQRMRNFLAFAAFVAVCVIAPRNFT